MQINYNVEYYEYKNRIRNLTVEAKGVVKSEKFFPVYLNNGKEEIFKPISKTKPLATPFFAYSEVFWSTVINKYFDSTAPVYRLAICNGYSEQTPKYHNHGVIVPSILKGDEKLVNLLEYFKEHKDSNVNIDNYTNFCMINYDYTQIFNSQIFKENQELGKQLALQVLISILKADQNYHYENVGFIFKDGKPLRLAPPIDHEFSTIFLFIDCLDRNEVEFNDYKRHLLTEPINKDDTIPFLLFKEVSNIMKNLDLIVERYEDVVLEFLKSLEVLIYDLEHNPINLKNNNYLYPFNSDNYRAGIVAYKKNNPELSKKILLGLKQHEVDISKISKIVKEEILTLAKLLQKNLIHRLEVKYQKTLNFTNDH